MEMLVCNRSSYNSLTQREGFFLSFICFWFVVPRDKGCPQEIFSKVPEIKSGQRLYEEHMAVNTLNFYSSVYPDHFAKVRCCEFVPFPVGFSKAQYNLLSPYE